MEEQIKTIMASMMPTMMQSIKDEIIKAIAAEFANKAEEPKAEPKKGFKRSKSDYQPEEGIVNVCEYSESTIAVWGDLKGKKELLDVIKAAGSAKTDKGRDMYASFANSLNSIGAEGEHPCGWILKKEALIKNGMPDAVYLAAKLSASGANTQMCPSVSEITEARKAAKADEQKAEEPTPKADPIEPKKATKKEKPSIDPNAPENKAAAPTPKAAPTVKAPAVKTFEAMCYDVSKDDELGYKVNERNISQRGEVFVYQGTKGAIIYAFIGNDVDDGHAIYAPIAKVAGDLSSTIVPQISEWNAIAKQGVVNAVVEGKVKASNAIMYAYVDAGEQDAVNKIFEILEAA